MGRGQHREGYRRPRKGEPRRIRQPFAVEKLSADKREAVLEVLRNARAGRCTCAKRAPHWHSFEDLPEVVERETGIALSVKQVYGSYDVLIQQAARNAFEQDELADKNLRRYFGRTLKELPEAAVHALKAEVFGLQHARTPEENEKAKESFLLVVAKLIDAQAKEKRAEIEGQKVQLAKRKFEELRSRAEKATNEAAAKLGKGRAVTLADINRIRERTFGLPPVSRSRDR